MSDITAVRAKPILFSTSMVQAIMADQKSKTRRVMMPQPVMDEDGMWHWKDCQWMDGGLGFPESSIDDYARYQTGDILWVRETWRMYEKMVGKGEGCYLKQFYAYKADEGNPNVPKCCEWYDNIKPLDGGYHHEYKKGSWRPSIFMPREAARLFLRVTDVRVEQVQNITEEDALAEGVPDEWPMEPAFCPKCKGEGLVGTLHPVSLGYMEIECPQCVSGIVRFSNLWDSLNAKRGYGWDSNPWVLVYEFERCEKPEEAAP